MEPAADSNFDYTAMERTFQAAGSKPELYQAIVDSPFVSKAEAAFIFLGIVVLLLVDKTTGTIDRVALSSTSHADGSKEVSVKRFEDIRVPLDTPGNLIAKVIREGRPDATTDWKYLFAPELTAAQARMNQAGGGIGYSAVYPVGGSQRGALIFSYFQYPEAIASVQRHFMENYSALVSKYL